MGSCRSMSTCAYLWGPVTMVAFVQATSAAESDLASGKQAGQWHSSSQQVGKLAGNSFLPFLSPPGSPGNFLATSWQLPGINACDTRVERTRVRTRAFGCDDLASAGHSQCAVWNSHSEKERILLCHFSESRIHDTDLRCSFFVFVFLRYV